MTSFFAPKEKSAEAHRTCFLSKANTQISENGWTAGSRAGVARRGLIGASCGWDCLESFAEWWSIPVISRATIPSNVRWRAGASDGLTTTEELTAESVPWTEILAKIKLNGDSLNPFAITSEQRWTPSALQNLSRRAAWRVCAFYGEVLPDWNRLNRIGGEIDLAAVENGGMVLSCSDMFFWSSATT